MKIRPPKNMGSICGQRVEGTLMGTNQAQGAISLSFLFQPPEVMAYFHNGSCPRVAVPWEMEGKLWT
jgi:hypothetical protein